MKPVRPAADITRFGAALVGLLVYGFGVGWAAGKLGPKRVALAADRHEMLRV